ncbi:hypothetical protein NIES4072_65110 [Nostoc commune NIES-4072]|uniref:Uncharacterized protein n=1 Tax=Nostoc commune NIES-4072 TaxID=2005467 RepID=A0A2R5FXL0_NOSCO|nr:phage tail protein [Nostoc commune]BBD70146.1 hypothetical protein NIES4070_65570 [Nostoc commune HK-02]GBG22799.1 hypothetical protein NIES4072_65110 [Nostoc commune NIES-4072]
MAVEVISSSNFIFEFGGTVYPIKSFSGIDVEAKIAAADLPIASGAKAQVTYQTTSSGYTDNKNFTIEAALEDGNKKLFDVWAKALPATYTGGGGKWNDGYTDGKITILDASGGEVVSYDLKQCQIVSYSVSDFDVASKDILMESFEFNAQMIQRSK